MHFTDLDHQIAVGASLSHAEDIDFLESVSVMAVVCLQSEEDITDTDLAPLRTRCDVLGIHHIRVPIIDFDPEDLLASLDDAVAAVQAEVERGRKVYVHCNVGLNRSPSVVIAWLVAHRGMALQDATDWLMERREVFPYPDIMSAWAERHDFPR